MAMPFFMTMLKGGAVIEMKMIDTEEMKMLQLEMMDFFHAFCMNRGLKYSLTGGTLLGAVRHQGYIPWDDDIDIAMPRKDYDVLIAEFNKESGNHFALLSVESDGKYYLPYAKIINTRTVLKETIDVNESIGVYIDIFPLDNMGDEIKKARRMFTRILRKRRKLALKTIAINSNRAWYKNLVLKVGKCILSSKSPHDLALVVNNSAKKYSGVNMTRFICPVVNALYGKNEILESKVYSKIIELPFEGRNYLASSEYHTILSRLYGDYMKLPPKEKQISHHAINAYWKEKNDKAGSECF